MDFAFSKYIGCGNDFICFDNRLNLFPHNKELISNLCHRQCGIGADGIILLENSTAAHYKMRIFNADGSEAEMCGNGIRCLGHFLEDLNEIQSEYKIETFKSLLTLSRQKKNFTVEMGSPVDLKWNIDISYQDNVYKVHSLDTGVPHVVIFVDDIENIDLKQLGPFLRYHPQFAPRGTNVNIAQILPNKKIKIRTYERGVEDETLACGTGATAVGLAASHLYGLNSPISIITRLKEELIIGFEKDFTNVTLSGPTKRTFKGIVKLE